MKQKLWLLIAVTCIGLATIWHAPALAAQAKTSPEITFNSFTGIYHLSRDSRGLSLLTTEETIVADFPNGGFYGIKRELPKNYQNHSVDVKILSITDAAGDPIPYKTTENPSYLTITTGDPTITLLGSQTIKISYQTSGVINLGQKTDDFLLNVNGRGWDQSLGRVNTTLYIPTSFGTSLTDNPTCYVSPGNNTCRINTQKNNQQITITSSASAVAAHQALVLRLHFKPATFTNNHPPLSIPLIILAGVILLAAILIVLYHFVRHRHRQ
jgi:hypothetical protein